MGWFRRTFKNDPVLTWNVQFEPDGHIYTYRRTIEQFKSEMLERNIARGDDPPYRVQVVRNGQLVDVNLEFYES